MFGLEDKIFVVTGGSKGIGAATAILLKSQGAKVISISRHLPEYKHDGVIYMECNVTDKMMCESVFKHIEQEIGEVSGIVINAGINRDKSFAKLEDAQWHEVIETNLTGAYNCARFFAPKFFTRKSGSVVFVSSIIGEKGNLGQANYAASKAALIGLMKSLALEGARYNVRFNAVSPGFIETDMTASIPADIKQNLIANIPMKRFGNPSEVAWAILFLLSPIASSFISGEVLRVNGAQLT